MSILDKNYIQLEDLKMRMSQAGYPLGTFMEGVMYDAMLINDIPTMIVRLVSGSVLPRFTTTIKLNTYGFMELIQAGCAIKIEYDPSQDYGKIVVQLAMRGMTPEIFHSLLEGIPIDYLTLNMYNVFEFRLKEYFTKKMIVKALNIVDNDIFSNHASDHPRCDLTVHSNFWKICPELYIANMRTIHMTGGIANYSTLVVHNDNRDKQRTKTV